MGQEHIALSGVRIDCVDLATAAARLASFVAAPRFHHVVTVNLDYLRLGRADPEFRRLLNEADLAVADGMPLVWASRLRRDPLPERVTGNALVDECARLSAATGAGIFLLGAADGVAELAARRIALRYPGAALAGTLAPPFRPLAPEEDEAIVERINASGARILLVAFGAPRQDAWIARHRGTLAVRVAIGVGCALDVLAGNVPRAPAWMQRTGLEWLYRLGREPRRLWRRYVLEDMPMLVRLLTESARSAAA